MGSCPSSGNRDAWEAGASGVTIEHAAVVTLNERLAGIWKGEQGETYSIQMAEGAAWICEYVDSNRNRQNWILCYDEQSDAVWWGSAWSEYLDASELCAQSDCIRWFG